MTVSTVCCVLRRRLDSCFSSIIVNGSLQSDASEKTNVEGSMEQESSDANGGPHKFGSASSDLAHDAGYDSLMTSMVFLMQLGQVLQQKAMTWETLHFRYAQDCFGARFGLALTAQLTQAG